MAYMGSLQPEGIKVVLDQRRCNPESKGRCSSRKRPLRAATTGAPGKCNTPGDVP
jgi:hypothetical protein